MSYSKYKSYQTATGLKIEYEHYGNFREDIRDRKQADELQSLVYNDLLRTPVSQRMAEYKLYMVDSVPIAFTLLPYENKEDALLLLRHMEKLDSTRNSELITFALEYCHNGVEPGLWSDELPDLILKGRFESVGSIQAFEWQFFLYCIFRKYLLHDRPLEAIAAKRSLEAVISYYPLLNFYKKAHYVDLIRFMTSKPEWKLDTHSQYIFFVRDLIPFMRQEPLYLNHPEVYELYRFGYDIPDSILNSIKSLPEVSLIEDLRTVLNDGIVNLKDYKDMALLIRSKEYAVFVYNAVRILIEKEAKSAYEALIPFLIRQELFQFYFFGVSKYVLNEAFMKLQSPPWLEMLPSAMEYLFDKTNIVWPPKKKKPAKLDELRIQKKFECFIEQGIKSDSGIDVSYLILADTKKENRITPIDNHASPYLFLSDSGLDCANEFIYNMKLLYLIPGNKEEVVAWCLKLIDMVSMTAARGKKWNRFRVGHYMSIIKSIQNKKIQTSLAAFLKKAEGMKRQEKFEIQKVISNKLLLENHEYSSKNLDHFIEIDFRSLARDNEYYVDMNPKMDLDFDDLSPSWDMIFGMAASLPGFRELTKKEGIESFEDLDKLIEEDDEEDPDKPE